MTSPKIPDDLVAVYVADFTAAVQMVSVLEEAGIPAVLHNEIMSTLHPGTGPARVMVKAQDRTKAKQLVSDFQQVAASKDAVTGSEQDKVWTKRILFTVAWVLGALILGVWFFSKQANRPRSTINAFTEIYDLNEVGQYSEGVKLAERVLAEEQKRRPPSTTNLKSVLHMLMLLHEKLGHYDLALTYGKQLIQLYDSHRNSAEPGLVRTLQDVAILRTRLGQYEEAEGLYLRIIERRRTLFPTSHPDILRAREDLAVISLMRGQYETAEQYQQEVVSTCEETLGLAHPDTARAIADLALAERRLGKYNEAEQLYQRAVGLYESIYGQRHPIIGPILFEYAYMLRTLNRSEEAKQLEEEVETLRSDTQKPSEDLSQVQDRH